LLKPRFALASRLGSCKFVFLRANRLSAFAFLRELRASLRNVSEAIGRHNPVLVSDCFLMFFLKALVLLLFRYSG
jgi:hypothetical protein